MRLPARAAALVLACSAVAASAADLGTHPFLTVVGNPALSRSGPSWVSVTMPEGTGRPAVLNQIQMGYFFEVAGPAGVHSRADRDRLPL